MHHLQIREVMTSPVVTVEPDALAVDAAQLMEEFGVRRLPVVDDEGCLVGIITDADVLEAETAGSVLSSYEPGVEVEWLTVADVMTSDVITIGPEATVGELAITLVEHKIGGVPVVEASEESGGLCGVQVVGMVTETDIFSRIADAWRAEMAVVG